MRKNYGYKEIDGQHWPDATKGDELYYSIDFTQWLIQENDTKVSVTWDVPDNITNLDDFSDGTTAYIKLRTDNVGTYKIVCNLNIIEGDKTQLKVIPMMLKVF